jgi:OB-fold nucleic acid binding domain.
MPEIKVKDMKKGMNNISATLKVISKENERIVQTKYGETRVSNAIVEDDTGRINLTLWRDQIDKVNVGDIIKIEGGFITEFKGQLNINVAKSGKITVIKRSK